MNPWPRPDAASMNEFYSNPDRNGDGVPDRAWEDANLTGIIPPYRMVLAWAPETPVRTIRIHKRCAISLAKVLKAIADHYGDQAGIEAARMHLYGGAYNFRLKRGGSTLSNHSWGSAIDLDPERNGFGVKWRHDAGMMPPAVVEMFAAEGWAWGGTWAKADGMHFEAVNRGP